MPKGRVIHIREIKHLCVGIPHICKPLSDLHLSVHSKLLAMLCAKGSSMRFSTKLVLVILIHPKINPIITYFISIRVRWGYLSPRLTTTSLVLGLTSQTSTSPRSTKGIPKFEFLGFFIWKLKNRKEKEENTLM